MSLKQAAAAIEFGQGVPESTCIGDALDCARHVFGHIPGPHSREMAVAYKKLVWAQQAVSERLVDDHDEISRLRAALRLSNDMLAELLNAARFPAKGRSTDDKDATQNWWEDHVSAVQNGYAALAGEDVLSWVTAHPGLYIPPAGAIRLDRGGEKKDSAKR